MHRQYVNAIFLAVMLVMAALIIYPMINEVNATENKKKYKKEYSEHENTSLGETNNITESSDQTNFKESKINNSPNFDRYGKEFSKYDGVHKDYFSQKKIKEVVCEDTGLFADSLEDCPILCPQGSIYEGFYVNNFNKCNKNLNNGD